MVKRINSFPKIESQTHTLRVRGDKDRNNKLVPRAYACDFCGQPFNTWLFSDIYLPLVTASGEYIVSFGVSCCPECRKNRRKITVRKGLSIALTVVCWVALFFAISSMVMAWAKAPELWVIFLVIPVFIASMIMLVKAIVPLYERFYANKYSTKHPVEVASRYQLWWQLHNKGWKILRGVGRDDKQNGESVGSMVGSSVAQGFFDSLF